MTWPYHYVSPAMPGSVLGRDWGPCTEDFMRCTAGLVGRVLLREEHVLAFSLQGTWQSPQPALSEGTQVPLTGGLSGESSTFWQGAR